MHYSARRRGWIKLDRLFLELRRRLLIGALAVLVGCDVPVGAPRVPDEIVPASAAGVITATDERDDGRLITFSGGEEVLLPLDATELYGLPAKDTLMLMGSGGPSQAESDAWFAALSARGSDDCYVLSVNGEVRGDRLATSLGFSVPLSNAWNETDEVFVNSPPVGFCLNKFGEADRPLPR